MADSARDAWILLGEIYSYPKSCPNCGNAPALSPIALRDGVMDWTWLEWPHCARCAAALRRRRRMDQALVVLFVVGLVIATVSALLLFQVRAVAIEDAVTAIAVGAALLSGAALILGLLFWIHVRVFPVRGVHVKSIFWEGDDRIPLPGTPTMVRLRFRHLRVRTEFMALNPHTTSASLEGIRSAGHAQAALESIRPEAEARIEDESNRKIRDSWSGSWQMAEILSLIVAVFSVGVLAGVTSGRARGVLAGESAIAIGWSCIALVSSIGVLLRFEIARRVAGLNALTIAGVLLISAALQIWMPDKGAGLWTSLGMAVILTLGAMILDSDGTRRMCRRWGVFGR